MNIRKILTLLFIVLLYGCGTTKRSAQSPGTGSGISFEGEKKILYPSNHDNAVIYNNEGTATLEGHKQASRPTNGYPEIKFNSTESAHVRVSGINPLPEGGLLILDLNELEKEFCFPYKGKFLSDYGMRGRAMHTGVDIKTIPDDTIRSAFPGVVRMSKMYSGYGNIVVVRHYHGFETVYAHCSRNLVKVNDVVDAGTPIGLAGRTGRATTEHLHFEVRAAGEHLDPNKLIDVEKMRLRNGKLHIQQRNGKVVAYNSHSELQDIEEKEKVMELSRQRAEADNRPSGTASQKTNTATAKSNPSNSANTATQSSSASSSSQPQYYQVKKGDTLYGIAQRNSTTVKKLCELNNISEKTLLQINQKLRIR